MLTTYEDVHPDLYSRVPRDSVATLVEELKARCDHPMTRRESWPQIARLVSTFGDGHTGALFPQEEIKRFTDRGGQWFPLEVDAFMDGALRVREMHGPASPIKAGAWITRINGRPVEDLFPELMDLVSGEKDSYRTFVVQNALETLLWLDGIRAPFEIEWRNNADQASGHATLQGVPLQVLRKARSRRHASSEDFHFEDLDGGFGYLEFRRMRRPRAFNEFLQETFQRIHDRPIRGLVIDLRRNGGGSTRLGDLLLSYITDQPYRMIARMDLKVSRQKKQWLKKRYLPRALQWLPLQYITAGWRQIWSAPEGSIVTSVVEPSRPPDNPLRYRGPVCVLIGPRTFSSAQKLTNAIKDFKLATLIGQETGGVPNAFGEAYTFRLPHTRLLVRVSTKRYVRANGDASWSRGIPPDIEVIPSPAELGSDRDPVLEAARAWLAGHQRKRQGVMARNGR